MTIFRDRPELLESFKAGDREALSQVYRFYVRPVERYLRTLAASAAKGELCQSSTIADLLQDIFIRAFSPSARSAYDGKRPYAGYIKAIARNCFIDALRVRQHEPVSTTLDTVESSTSYVDASEGFDPRLWTVVNEYLRQLPGILRGVYEARFVNGRSQDASANALGLSRRQLRTSEAKLRQGLRIALSRSGVWQNDLAEVCLNSDFHSS